VTTIPTGGVATPDGSVGHFDNWQLDLIVTSGMLVGGMPFLLCVPAGRGKPLQLRRDEQVRGYIAIAGSITLVVAALLWFETGMNPAQALRYSAFNVVSVMTGTGYTNHDYGLWGSFALPIFFFIMFIGGCAGSTTCGIKIFRFQVIFAALRVQIRRIIHPHGVFFPQYNSQKINHDLVSSVANYFFLFFVSFSVLAIGLSLMGLDTITALSSAGTAIANVGPGLGSEVGPASTFANLPNGAKWLMSFGMLLGRLELFTVLVMLTPGFWKM